MHTSTTRLPYSDALPIYRNLKGNGPSCLFESASATDKSSRLSVLGFEPTLELIGKDEHLDIRLLDARATVFYDFIKAKFARFVENERTGRLLLRIPKTAFQGAEEDRLERQNIVQPLRSLLAEFKTDDKNFMGFYGALAYQFVYQFEDLANTKPCPEPCTAETAPRLPGSFLLFPPLSIVRHAQRDFVHEARIISLGKPIGFVGDGCQ